MLDFLMITTRSQKNGTIEIYPKFIIKNPCRDLMIRGSDFYAVWKEEEGLWGTNEQDVIDIVDRELKEYAKKYVETYNNTNIKVLYMWDAETGIIDNWHKYVQRQMRDSYVMLDENLNFVNTESKKENYSSKKLNYPLESGSIDSWDKLIGTLYTKEERHKIEWSIGSIVNGDSKLLQKFLVLYGSAGTGKSTILNIIQSLFDGYYSVFDARALGSSSASFALEAFRSNPLVAIQHDGDLSRIEDNTRLNSLVSHEALTVNEKYKSTYSNAFKTFLYMGTNKPVKITDAKSGLIRRLIDVTPSGEKLKPMMYRKCVNGVKFELGAIAWHCKEVYEANPDYYDDYIPKNMMSASNDFYNFVMDSYYIFKKTDAISLKRAWDLYKLYVSDANVPYPFSQRIFKEELKNYFKEFKERYTLEDGTRARNYYIGFKTDIIDGADEDEIDIIEDTSDSDQIEFFEQCSIFDTMRKDCLAQLATKNETPSYKWDNVKTTLSDIDTKKLHYVKLPENHIIIDFDLKKDGKKSLELNIKEASKWPKTYAELSKSGNGVHLHYIYTGDIDKLLRVYSEGIEIKVYTGNASLRRKLTKCNSEHVSIISSGLPIKTKGGKKVIGSDIIKSERKLKEMIERNLEKEFHHGTKPSIDFIKVLIDEAHENNVKFDLTSMYTKLVCFAMNSTNRADYCLEVINSLKLCSDEMDMIENISPDDEDDTNIVFFDIEVFPNVNFLNFKQRGTGKIIRRFINPTPEQIEAFLQFKLVGFNNRGYDNHIIYGMLLGNEPYDIYLLSKGIITNEGGKFANAYNISYTDIYDFASAGNKKALKKWQIELGIIHKELGFDWDKPVPEDKWEEVSAYCDNDVISAEIVFEHLKGDWTVRKMLAKVTNLTRNDTTNKLTTRLVFQGAKKEDVWREHRWRDLSKPVKELDSEHLNFLKEVSNMPIPFNEESLLPYFPGYKYEYGVSTYRGHKASEGGFVLTEEGMHENVGLLDVTSEHPWSLILEYLLGKYTRRFYELVATRVDIKHKDLESAKNRLDGVFREFLEDPDMSPKDVSNGAKTPINSAYGLTCAGFDNEFKGPNNIDNIVAKRGALFMIDLYEALTAKGWKVVHIKTDSVKIADITQEKIDFVHEFGKKYGYGFEHEATYSKFCILNKAVYAAKHSNDEVNKEKKGTWTSTGMPLIHPYIFKKLFTGEDISHKDMYEVRTVKTALYLDFNEKLVDVSLFEAELKKRRSKVERKTKMYPEMTDEDLVREINYGHDYTFVGRVGSFLPVKAGCGGGILCRESTDGSMNSAPNSKGYRWKEVEVIESLNLWDQVDYEFHEALVEVVVDNIRQYGNEEMFLEGSYYGIPIAKIA